MSFRPPGAWKGFEQMSAMVALLLGDDQLGGSRHAEGLNSAGSGVTERGGPVQGVS